MAFNNNNNGGHQAPMFGDPNLPSGFYTTTPRYMPVTKLDIPVRPESSASNISSNSSGLDSQISYDGGVALPPPSDITAHGRNAGGVVLPPDSIVSSYIQQTRANATGIPSVHIQAPTPARTMKNNIALRAAHADASDVFTGGPRIATQKAYSVGPSVGQHFGPNNGLLTQPAPAYVYGNGNRNDGTFIGNCLGAAGAFDNNNNHSRVNVPQQRAINIYDDNVYFAPRVNHYPAGTYNPQPYKHEANKMQPLGRTNSQASAYRANIPQYSRVQNPLNTFSRPPNAFAGPSLTRGSNMANIIRSGAFDGGVSIDPDEVRTPPATGSNRRRTSSVTFSTPTRARRNGYGSTPSRSGRSSTTSTMSTPTNNRQLVMVDQTPTSRNIPTSGLLPGQTMPLPGWYHSIWVKRPTLEEALTSLPFSSPFEGLPARDYGVVKFVGIPYATTKNELLSVLGRNSTPINMPLGSPYYAVHIVMDRITGKTGHGYVEVSNSAEARETVKWLGRRGTNGSRALKIGDREVTVEFATQEELMAALFPHPGTMVEWSGSTPRVINRDTSYYADSTGTGFTGFVGKEELSTIMKFVENPARSAFAQRTPFRLYECIISTVHRLPWHTPQYINLAQRKKLYDAVRVCVRCLAAAILRDDREKHVGLSLALLQELATAALSCVGFSEQQKASLVSTLTMLGHESLTTGQGMNVHLGGSGLFSATWPFLALSPRATINSEMVKYYASLIAKATDEQSTMSLYDLAAKLTSDFKADPKPFGEFSIAYNSDDMVSLSLQEIVKCELSAVAEVLATELLTPSTPIYELE